MKMFGIYLIIKFKKKISKYSKLINVSRLKKKITLCLMFANIWLLSRTQVHIKYKYTHAVFHNSLLIFSGRKERNLGLVILNIICRKKASYLLL